jgi:hypothetical protein
MPPPPAFVLRAPITGRNHMAMDQDITERPPTSSAATRETEPEVVAAVSSAEGSPNLPLSFRIGGISIGHWRAMMLLAGGLAVGYGVSRWLMRHR